MTARGLPGRHADRAVEPHILAIEVRVGDHGVRELRILVRPAEAAREGTRAPSAAFTASGARCSSGVSKMPGRMVLTRIASLEEIACNGQRHADDAGLRRGVGNLPDLPIFAAATDAVLTMAPRSPSGSGSSVSMPAALFGDATEGADQIDLDDPLEILQRIFLDLAGLLVAGDGFRRSADARAVPLECAPDRSLRVPWQRPHRPPASRLHIDLAEHAAELLRQRLAEIAVQIEQGDLDAVRRQHPRGGSPETRSTAGDDGRN